VRDCSSQQAAASASFNTGSEISLFLLAPIIEDLPRIGLPFRQRSPVGGLSGWLARWPGQQGLIFRQATDRRPGQ